jgi:hypothetical protein
MMSRRAWSLSDDHGFSNLDDHREAMPDPSFHPGVSRIKPGHERPHRTLPEPCLAVHLPAAVSLPQPEFDLSEFDLPEQRPGAAAQGRLGRRPW